MQLKQWCFDDTACCTRGCRDDVYWVIDGLFPLLLSPFIFNNSDIYIVSGYLARTFNWWTLVHQTWLWFELSPIWIVGVMRGIWFLAMEKLPLHTSSWTRGRAWCYTVHLCCPRWNVCFLLKWFLWCQYNCSTSKLCFEFRCVLVPGITSLHWHSMPRWTTVSWW